MIKKVHSGKHYSKYFVDLKDVKVCKHRLDGYAEFSYWDDQLYAIMLYTHDYGITNHMGENTGEIFNLANFKAEQETALIEYESIKKDLDYIHGKSKEKDSVLYDLVIKNNLWTTKGKTNLKLTYDSGLPLKRSFKTYTRLLLLSDEIQEEILRFNEKNPNDAEVGDFRVLK